MSHKTPYRPASGDYPVGGPCKNTRDDFLQSIADRMIAHAAIEIREARDQAVFSTNEAIKRVEENKRLREENKRLREENKRLLDQRLRHRRETEFETELMIFEIKSTRDFKVKVVGITAFISAVMMIVIAAIVS